MLCFQPSGIALPSNMAVEGVDSEKLAQLKSELKANCQEHLLQFWEKLDPVQQKELFDSISS